MHVFWLKRAQRQLGEHASLLEAQLVTKNPDGRFLFLMMVSHHI